MDDPAPRLTTPDAPPPPPVIEPAGSDPAETAGDEAAPAPRVGARLDRRDFLALGALLAVFALARVPLFPFAENLYGDSVVRSEIAERWANNPTLYTSFDEVFQFGPLHFYYMGALLKAWPAREHATRLASLLMGLLLVLPVYRLGKRLFSRRAAVVCALCIGVWGLHIQASITAASEAVFLTLFFFALDYLFQGIEEQRFTPMAIAALFTNLFCAMRYDGWMYAPLLGLTVALAGKDRIASATRAVLFLALCAPFPLWWMQMNEKAKGDALYAIHYIDQFHTNWVKDGSAWLGSRGQRTLALFFWPGAILVSCSLLVGLFALAGLVRSLVKRQRWALAMLAIVPAAYYTFRGAVLLNFTPLARFFMAQIALALFYVDDGFAWLCGRLPALARKAIVVLSAVLAVGTTVWLGYLTAWKSGGTWTETLRPISPLTTIPVDQMALARWLKDHVGAREVVIIDEAPQYLDINIAFFTGLPEERLARCRWENFEKQLLLHPETQWMFLAKGGTLEAKEGLRPDEEAIAWRGGSWKKVFSPSAGLFVYHRQ